MMLLPASISQASGLRVDIVSASALGTANAGVGASSEDASIVYYNPAAMSDVKKPMFSGGVFQAVLDGQLSDFDVRDRNGSPITISDNYDDGGDFLPDAVFPFLYYIQPITEKIHAGLGIYPAFSAHTEYSPKAIVGHFAGVTQLQVLDIQPTISYKLNNVLSVAFGVDVLLAQGKLSSMQFPDIGSGSGGFSSEVVVEGDDTATTWHAALKLEPIKGTTIGATYRHGVDLTLEGEALMIQIGSKGLRTLTQKEDGFVPIKLPKSLDLYLHQKLTEKINLLATVNWSQWSVFQKLDIIGSEGGGISRLQTDLNVGGTNYLAHVNTAWADVLQLSIGNDYQYSDNLTLRAGFMYVPNNTLNEEVGIARVPDSTKYWLTTGAKYAFDSHHSIDVGVAYIAPVKVKIDDFDVGLDNKKLANSPTAKANSEVNAFTASLQYNYQF